MLIERMIRAAKLEVHLYEEVEADAKATPQAMWVVVITSLAGGLGTAGSGLIRDGAGPMVGALILGTLVALAAWVIWASLTYWIGTTLFRGPKTSATVGELLRTIGFSATPGVIRVLGVVPALYEIAFIVAGLWSLVAMVIAVRQALDFSTGRAIGTCLAGWVVQGLFLAALLLMIR